VRGGAKWGAEKSDTEGSCLPDQKVRLYSERSGESLEDIEQPVIIYQMYVLRLNLDNFEFINFLLTVS
jgi:hypothetical protein